MGVGDIQGVEVFGGAGVYVGGNGRVVGVTLRMTVGVTSRVRVAVAAAVHVGLGVELANTIAGVCTVTNVGIGRFGLIAVVGGAPPQATNVTTISTSAKKFALIFFLLSRVESVWIFDF